MGNKDICESCGVDWFKGTDYDKMSREGIELRDRFKRASAEHGLRQAEWTIREIELTESMKYLQQKVVRQTKAIRTLEAKIKRLGEYPYEEEDVI